MHRVLLSVPGKAAHHHADDAMLCAQAEILCDGWCEWDRSEMELAVARKIRWNLARALRDEKRVERTFRAPHQTVIFVIHLHAYPRSRRRWRRVPHGVGWRGPL